MIAAVIPCYRVRKQILDVLKDIGPEVQKVYVVDDACPEESGKLVADHCKDPRIEVLYHKQNRGVGGAVKTGYKKAVEDGADIVVKIDGDLQMNPKLIPDLIQPILGKEADYVKGNRFWDLAYLQRMPASRKFGNTILSFINKAVTGYWNVMDPTNGFTAISARVLKFMPLEKISNRFFFEQDMLFRLNTIRAVVVDFPMESTYMEKNSNLGIARVLFSFPVKYPKRFLKRIFYSYFLRDFNIGSLELILSFLFTGFGVIFGTIKWIQSAVTMHPATAGTVILAGLPVILGFQSFLAFLHYDLTNVPEKPVSF
jgi:dolichol-phosphate mannosyltransferase